MQTTGELDVKKFVMLTVLVEEEGARLGVVGLFEVLLGDAVAFVKLFKLVVHELLDLLLVLRVRSATKDPD